MYKIDNIDIRESLQEAIRICESAMISVRYQCFWYLLAVFLLIVPIIWSMGLDSTTTSIGICIGLNIGRLVLTALLCYALFMSFIWNSVERNALKAGCLAMKIHLIQLTNRLSN